jgi:2-oxoglutarate dehydrogenase E1 component
VTSLIQQFAQSSQLAGGNAAFVEELYERYLADPAAVDSTWRAYFDQLGGRQAGDQAHGPIVDAFARLALSPPSRGMPSSTSTNSDKQAGVLRLVTAFRARGHLAANLDPLGLARKTDAPDLDLPFHGLGPADLDTEFATGSLSAPPRLKLRDIVGLLQRTYASSIGAEFMHISDAEQRRWMHEQLERTGGRYEFSPEERRRTLTKLTQAEGLERYLHTKYVGQKRFSLEGGDALIPMMDELIRRAGSTGVREIVIGMAHRGRLNVLINTLGKPPHTLFAEFEGRHEGPDDPAHSGDVKYHMGFSSDIATPGGPVHLALGFNPSHLEIIDPVVVGSVRARQLRREDLNDHAQVMPVLIHGDAAFAGQGVVMETFQMSQARGFKVGGTVHLVINNQVGFTTHRPDDARSTLYCTDVAKMVGAPILHVNGDDPEACLFAVRLAYDYRAKFKRDVVIDLVCYRRHGHNEADEPAATQPLMYQNIRARKSPRELYAERLATEAAVGAEDAKRLVDDYRAALDRGDVIAEIVTDSPVPTADWTRHLEAKPDPVGPTSLPEARLRALGEVIAKVPDGFVLHPRVAKVYEDRAKMARGEMRMDWGFAENLAYASLLDQGYRLRIVGQDAGRGTFFHRHAVLHDQKTGQSDLPLRAIAKRTEDITLIDSLLSEEAVMAFEYGYSTTDPNTMVIWEGQFGDFANGAQVVIDQFISSGEAKWGRLSSLALFLPHGYEGQGPEHSSARLERFLQLCALENMQVVVPTTPGQFFHMIRRQMVRDLRKPLVVMTPKSMLRLPRSTSAYEDLSERGFQLMIPDSTAKDPKKVKRVVACAGKVYWDLVEEAEKKSITDVAIVRIEQLYPFPREALAAEFARFGAAKDVVWCQEEPQNQGAWYQIQHHLRHCLAPKQSLHYAGRPRSPAPACGHLSTHVAEQAALVQQAMVAKLDGDFSPSE